MIKEKYGKLNQKKFDEPKNKSIKHTEKGKRNITKMHTKYTMTEEKVSETMHM